MLSVLIRGELTGNPEARTDRHGKEYLIAWLRLHDFEGSRVDVTVAAFRKRVISQLRRLEKNDEVAIVGDAALRRGDEAGEISGFYVVAASVMTVFDSPRWTHKPAGPDNEGGSND